MQVDLGVYVETAGANNAATTRHATYLYRVIPTENELIKRLVWGADSRMQSIDAIEPGAFNNLTDLEYIDVNIPTNAYSDKMPQSYCGLLWQNIVDSMVLICCPQRYFQSDANVDLPGVPQYAQSLAVGDYGFYNVKFRRTEPIPMSDGIQQFSFTSRELANVTGLGDCSFANTNITQLTIWPELVHMGMYTFLNCHNLKKVTLLEGCKSFGLSKIPSGAFYNCDALEEVRIPEGVVYIGSNAFAYCKQLKRVYIPKTLSCICKDAFKECNDVEIVVPSDSHLKHIGVQEYVYLAGEPNLEINECRTHDVQLEYYRNNYAIQNILDISAIGGAIHFVGETNSTKLPRAVQLLQRR